MKKRIWELDAFRGLCLLGMVLIHLIYDLTELYGFVGWKTPLEINLISSRRDLLAAFFGEFMEMLDNKLREWSAEDEAEDESE